MKSLLAINRKLNNVFTRLRVTHFELNKRFFVVVALLVFTVFLSLRLLNFISMHAVNLLFWDQWDFLTPLFEQQDFWTMFNYQHGPHRQGLGLLFTKLTADLTHWNTRAESFLLALLVFIAMLGAFALKFSIYKNLSLNDIFIPLIFLNLTQYETFIGTPNPAHSAAPLLLSILYCLAWLIPNSWIKTLAVLVLNFMLLYTGFGVFMGIITIGLILLESIQNARVGKRRSLVVSGFALSLSVFSIGIFLKDYTFTPAVECFGITKSNLLKTPFFMSLMFARFIRLGFQRLLPISIIVGFFLLFASLLVFSYHTHKLTKIQEHAHRSSIIIAILIGYTILFSLSTAIGRTCMGLESAFASRYATLMIPAFLGLYLYLCSIRNVFSRKVLKIFALLLICISHFPFRPADRQIITWYSVNKSNWQRCYLEYESIDHCDATVDFLIHPDASSTQLKWKLDYLKQNNLNLFLEVHEGE